MKATRHLIVAAIIIAVAMVLMSSVFAGDDSHAAADGDVFTIVQNGVEITYGLSVPGDGSEYVIVTGAVETDEESTSYSLVIPATVRYDETDYDVKMVGYDAFYGCSSLTSITIPSSVEYLGDSAFYGCSSLTSITIPSSVEYLGDSAFHECESLESATLACSCPIRDT